MVLCLITAVVFWPTLHFDFVDWDDPIEVLTNPYVEGLTWTNLKAMFTNYDRVRRYHPLDWLGWSVNYQIDGRRPLGYHLGNLLEHLASVVLVYFLVLKLLRLWWDASRPGVLGDAPLRPHHFTFAAAAGTLWWAIHPLRAEPVAWVTGRIYTQCAMFLAACLLCYVASREQGRSGTAHRLLYAASVVFFVGSLLSHAIATGAAVVILLLDIYPLRRFSRDGSNRWWGARARRIYVDRRGGSRCRPHHVVGPPGRHADLEASADLRRISALREDDAGVLHVRVLPLDTVDAVTPVPDLHAAGAVPPHGHDLRW